MSEYDDIINLPHHVSHNHPQMSMWQRAAQFAPFAALTGYDRALAETLRSTVSRLDLSEDDKERLNRQLVWISQHLHEMPIARITFFIPDSKKAGGNYKQIEGCIEAIHLTDGTIQMAGKSIIAIANLQSISNLHTKNKIFQE